MVSRLVHAGLHHSDVETSHISNRESMVFAPPPRYDQQHWLETPERRMDFANWLIQCFRRQSFWYSDETWVVLQQMPVCFVILVYIAAKMEDVCDIRHPFLRVYCLAVQAGPRTVQYPHWKMHCVRPHSLAARNLWCCV